MSAETLILKTSLKKFVLNPKRKFFPKDTKEKFVWNSYKIFGFVLVALGKINLFSQFDQYFVVIQCHKETQIYNMLKFNIKFCKNLKTRFFLL